MAEPARCSDSPRHILAAVSIRQGLWTTDYGLRTTDYGLRTTDYGLGIKYGLKYKTRTEHYGLGINTKKGSILNKFSHERFYK